jgi:MarR family transcriptional regulator, negative regulator of the multidrug operon emrRAB
MVRLQMNNPNDTPFEMIEANLHSLALRMPDVPTCSILLTRVIMHNAREMAARFEHHVRPCGLTEAEFRVLTTLYSQPDGMAHPGDLCLRTSQSAAHMSRICDALVARDLITRVLSALDRRRMVLRITEPGEALVRELLPRMFGLLRETMRDLTEAEQRELTQQLMRLGTAFERSPVVEATERAT